MSLYEHHVESCFTGNNLKKSQYETLLGQSAASIEGLRQKKADNSLPLLNLPSRRDDLVELQDIAYEFRNHFDDVVILGTGGSSLGGQTFYALANDPKGPQLHFMDNVDPDTFDRLFKRLDLERTGLIAISKSGTTAETLCQFLICADRFDDMLEENCVVITEPGDRPLRSLAEKWDIPVVDHDPLVGGRFSALSNVGLLPAMIAGLNVDAIREGAAEVLNKALSANHPRETEPAVGAAIAVGLEKHNGLHATVLMPYVDRLAYFGLWYRQLWAESLGKQGKGTVPIRAMGTVDQHSQVQLYLDGPRDKMFTVLMADQDGKGDVVDTDDPRLAYLDGRSMGDLMEAEQRAMAEAFIRSGCPTRIMKIRDVNEHTMGALMMHFMLETIIAADLLGVNAFDQPAVELGKQLTREYLKAS